MPALGWRSIPFRPDSDWPSVCVSFLGERSGSLKLFGGVSSLMGIIGHGVTNASIPFVPGCPNPQKDLLCVDIVKYKR